MSNNYYLDWKERFYVTRSLDQVRIIAGDQHAYVNIYMEYDGLVELIKDLQNIADEIKDYGHKD